MRRALACVVVGCAASLVALAGDDAAPPPPAATKPYSSPDGRVTIELPATWNLVRSIGGEAEMDWRGALPDGAGAIVVKVFRVFRMVNARAQPFIDRVGLPKSLGTSGPAHTETDELPHVWIDVPDPQARTRRHVRMYRVIRRNGFAMTVECDADAWPSVRTACLRAARTLTTTFEEWPTPPAGYRRRVHDGIVYYVHPDAGGSEFWVHQVVLPELRAFQKLHGPVSWEADSPVVVVVHAKTTDPMPNTTDFPQWRVGSWYDDAGRRLFALAPAKDDENARAAIAYDARSALITQTFDRGMPFWLRCGEPEAAWNTMMGMPPPCVPESCFVKSLPRFSEIAVGAPSGRAEQKAMVVYTVFFMCGPKLYRDAFASFLGDLAATGDGETAQRTWLLSLDQAELREAAQKFSEKELKPVKAK